MGRCYVCKRRIWPVQRAVDCTNGPEHQTCHDAVVATNTTLLERLRHRDPVGDAWMRSWTR